MNQAIKTSSDDPRCNCQPRSLVESCTIRKDVQGPDPYLPLAPFALGKKNGQPPRPQNEAIFFLLCILMTVILGFAFWLIISEFPLQQQQLEPSFLFAWDPHICVIAFELVCRRAFRIDHFYFEPTGKLARHGWICGIPQPSSKHKQGYSRTPGRG